MSTAWKIYYGDGSVYQGNSAEQWEIAPHDDVQVVVINRPSTQEERDARLNNGYVGCEILKPGVTFFTGVDYFDPLHYGTVKLGKLLSDEEYFAIWDRAYGAEQVS